MKEHLYTYRHELFLSLLTLVMLGFMEARHPYFFLQDDNRTYHLPYYVHNLKALLDGELPLFNFNQYLGTPVSFLSAPFYPVNYVALLLSRVFCGHYFAAMEFIAALHLLAAGIGFYRFTRSFRLDERACCFGAMAWAFSPFVITIGNSWIHTLGFAALLPWILLFSCRQLDGFGFRDALLLLLCRVLAVLLGYPQWFLYTVLFELLLLGSSYPFFRSAPAKRPGRIVAVYAGSYLALIIVTLPVLLQLFRETSLSFTRGKVLSWEEYTLYSYRWSEWLNGLIAPFNDTGSQLFGELNFVAHIGYLPLLFVLLALWNSRKSSSRREIFVFAGLGLFSLLWSMDIVITKIFYHLPLFNKLRYPFKLQFFTGFFLLVLATFGFHRFIGWVRERFQPATAAVIAAVIVVNGLNFLALYVLLPQRMLAEHRDQPPFSEPLAATLTNGRIVSAGPDVVWQGERVVPGNSVPTLGYNFAMLWGLQHVGGYEALLSRKNFTTALELFNNSIFEVEPGKPLDFSADVPLDYLRRWGVKWYVVNSQIPLAGLTGLEVIYRDRYRNVIYDPAGKSLVSWVDGLQAEPPAYTFRTNSIVMETRNPVEQILLVNVLYNPLFRAFVDGKETGVEEAETGQVLLAVPPGRHTVELKYRDSLFLKGALVSGFILLSLAVIRLGLKLRKPDRSVAGE